MKIGILGTGNMGKLLTLKLAQAGHQVKVANSRGADSIRADVLATGAVAVNTQDALSDIDVAILTVPLASHTAIKSLITALPDNVVVIDVSNYAPFKDNPIPKIDSGMVESVFVREFFGRPIAKAWNTVLAYTLEHKGQAKGHPDRLALAVAYDREQDGKIAMQLVEETGFDAFDAGSIDDSWRMQPASPLYCTELTLAEMSHAMTLAEKDRIPKRREIAISAIMERANGDPRNIEHDWIVRMARTLYM